MTDIETLGDAKMKNNLARKARISWAPNRHLRLHAIFMPQQKGQKIILPGTRE